MILYTKSSYSTNDNAHLKSNIGSLRIQHVKDIIKQCSKTPTTKGCTFS